MSDNNDDKLQQQIDDLKEQIETEKAKNAGLLDDLKKAQRDLRSKQEVKPEDLQAEIDRADKLAADLTEAQKQVKALTTERDKAVKALETESGFSTQMLTENALNTALAEAGVTVPGLLTGAKSMFGKSAQVVVDGDQRVVKIGDKTVEEAIKEWAATDDAKHYITAPNNSGGGAGGGKGGGNDNAKTMTRAEYNERAVSDPAGVQQFIRDGGKVVNEAA